jgi:hypothetical protein
VTTEAEAAGGPSAEELAGRLFDAGLKTAELMAVYIGDRLGLYRALAASGPATASELARSTGLNERHLREWLGIGGCGDIDRR